MRWARTWTLAVALSAGCRSLPPAGPEARGLISPPGSAAAVLEARQGGLTTDAAAEARMERLAARLAAGLAGGSRSCRCRLLASERLNAFSLPPGQIYVTCGLYSRLESDALLAAALAHELAHLDRRDHSRPPPATAAEALRIELRADRDTRRLLALAGFPETALADLLELITAEQPPAWAAARTRAALVGHPPSASRAMSHNP